MEIFAPMMSGGYEQVVFCHDKGSGLRSIIVVHDTTLGPGLGGVRMWPYETDADALRDCMRLARGMTYKAAAAGVNLGGAKSIIIGDPATQKSESLLRAHGRFIQSLNGRYIPGVDVGTDMADIEVIGAEAQRVSCVNADPAPMTALGVFAAIQACWEDVAGTRALHGMTIAIQGAGHVGSALARLLSGAGASVVVADLHSDRASRLAAELGVDVVSSDEIVGVPCDVFAPCAMGAVINDGTLPRLKCRVVAGAANNVLDEGRHGDALHEGGIVYAPDYYANAGGLILLEEEMLGHDDARRERRVLGVGDAVAAVLARSRQTGTPTWRVADQLAEERLRARSVVGPAYVAHSVHGGNRT